MNNEAVQNLDPQRFEGKWYSLYSIPTLMDKNWKQTIEHYKLHHGTHFDVLTTYHKGGKPEQKSISSKIFFNENHPDGEMKAQFMWPFKIGYRVIELAEDYSYVVVGHPDEKYLFIMAREPHIEPQLLKEIIERCRAAGYDTGALVSQEHSGSSESLGN